MAKPISIGVASDTREFSQGIKRGVIAPLDDAQQSLDDVERAGDAAGKELENAFERAARETSAFKKAQADAAREMREAGRVGKRAYDDIDDGARKAKRSTEDVGDSINLVGEGTKGFKDEAVSNFSEVASSFSGDMTQAADGVQGLLGGLASSLGPAGILVAAAGAAGGAFFANWQQAAEATEDRISDMYADMTESGERYLSEQFVNQAIQDLIGDEKRYARAIELSEMTGMSLSDVIRAMVTQGEERDRLNAKIEEGYAAETAAAAAAEDGYTYTGNAAAKAATRWADARAEVADWNSEQDQATNKAQVAAAAMRDTEDAADGAAGSLDGVAASAKGVPSMLSMRINVDDSEFVAWKRGLGPISLDVRVPQVAFDQLYGPGRLPRP